MSDLDRLLAESLKSVGDGYGPSDIAAARERFARRQRRRRLVVAASGVAVAGAVASIALLVSADAPPAIQKRVVTEVAGEPTLSVTTIAVGDSPSGIGLSEDSAWVANSGDGTVSRIDIGSNRETRLDVGGSPDDIAVTQEAIWVTDPGRGIATEIDPATNEVGREVKVGAPGQHIDVASSGETAWFVSGEPWVYRLDLESSKVDRHASFTGGLGDVATTGGQVWVLDPSTGGVGMVDAAAGAIPDLFELTGVPPSVGADLAVGPDGVWVTSPEAGAIYALDPEDLTTDARIQLVGSYAGLALGRDSLWVISGSGERAGRLTRIDALTHEIVGKPLFIDGKPYDIVLGEGALWITNFLDGSVTRVAIDDGPVAP